MLKTIASFSTIIILVSSCANRKEDPPTGGGCFFDSIVHQVAVVNITMDSMGVNLLLHSYEIDSLAHTIATPEYKAILEEKGRGIQVGDTLEVLSIKSLSPSCTDQKSLIRYGHYYKQLESKF